MMLFVTNELEWARDHTITLPLLLLNAGWMTERA